MKCFKLKDSGKREQHSSGAVRDIREGKGRHDLMSIFALKRYADIMERGAKKYDDRNWEKGMPMSRYVDSAIRHILQAMQGLTDEDHWGHAFWNIGAIMHQQELIALGILPPELNDLPDYKERKVDD